MGTVVVSDPTSVGIVIRDWLSGAMLISDWMLGMIMTSDQFLRRIGNNRVIIYLKQCWSTTVFLETIDKIVISEQMLGRVTISDWSFGNLACIGPAPFSF